VDVGGGHNGAGPAGPFIHRGGKADDGELGRGQGGREGDGKGLMLVLIS